MEALGKGIFVFKYSNINIPVWWFDPMNQIPQGVRLWFGSNQHYIPIKHLKVLFRKQKGINFNIIFYLYNSDSQLEQLIYFVKTSSLQILQSVWETDSTLIKFYRIFPNLLH